MHAFDVAIAGAGPAGADRRRATWRGPGRAWPSSTAAIPAKSPAAGGSPGVRWQLVGRRPRGRADRRYRRVRDRLAAHRGAAPRRRLPAHHQPRLFRSRARRSGRRGRGDAGVRPHHRRGPCRGPMDHRGRPPDADRRLAVRRGRRVGVRQETGVPSVRSRRSSRLPRGASSTGWTRARDRHPLRRSSAAATCGRFRGAATSPWAPARRRTRRRRPRCTRSRIAGSTATRRRPDARAGATRGRFHRSTRRRSIARRRQATDGCCSATPRAWSIRSRARGSTSRIRSGMLAAAAVRKADPARAYARSGTRRTARRAAPRGPLQGRLLPSAFHAAAGRGAGAQRRDPRAS